MQGQDGHEMDPWVLIYKLIFFTVKELDMNPSILLLASFWTDGAIAIICVKASSLAHTATNNIVVCCNQLEYIS